MVMSDSPCTVALDEQYGETRRSYCCLAILQTTELVKACNHDRTVAQDNGAPFADHALEATPLQRRKIFKDAVSPFGHDWTCRSKKIGVGPINLGQLVRIVGAEGRRPT